MRKKTIPKTQYSREALNLVRERLGLSTLEELEETGSQLPRKKGEGSNQVEEKPHKSKS